MALQFHHLPRKFLIILGLMMNLDRRTFPEHFKLSQTFDETYWSLLTKYIIIEARSSLSNHTVSQIETIIRFSRQLRVIHRSIMIIQELETSVTINHFQFREGLFPDHPKIIFMFINSDSIKITDQSSPKNIASFRSTDP